MIVIIDYGMGNLGSVLNMLKKVGAEATISSDPRILVSAQKLILPGVGAFDNGMKCLTKSGLIDVLREKVLRQETPILGICLGLQLFTKMSEEGSFPGLGWIDAETIRFQFSSESNGLKIPHMGWNELTIKREDSLFTGFEASPRFYFVHSYHVRCNNQDDILAECFYGINFTAAIRHRNIWGTQFHSEKSHKFGIKLLKNFTQMT